MKLASITAVLCATSLLAIVPAASAFAQDAHQHTETTPPATASAATPASPRMPSGMTPPPEMMQMMQMMQKMHSGAMPRMAMTGGALMPPGAAIQNVEGHIAFLKAELKITDAQQKSWDQFADALRTNAKALSEAPGTMMGGADKKMPLATRFEQQEKLLTLHLEALKRSRSALEALNAVLSDEQKKQLDELI
jgi:LTXXQ motif family protein